MSLNRITPLHLAHEWEGKATIKFCGCHGVDTCDVLTVYVPRGDWEDMGEPAQIVVTVQPFDDFIHAAQTGSGVRS